MPAKRFFNAFIKVVNYINGRREARRNRRQFVSLKPEGTPIGNVLISYFPEPLLLKPEEIPNSHTNFWECRQIVQTYLDMGYCVDVIHSENDVFVPQKHYTLFVEVRWTLQRIAHLLNPDCIKIFHADAASLTYHNAAEAQRLLALQQRRGVTLLPRRHERPNLAAEHADCITILGNDFTANTFKYLGKPIYKIPISTPVVYPWSESKDFDTCRQNFLWFGSGGLVHKGLDLVLEAFAQMPEYHLTICGPVQKETDFEKEYYKELYQTPNIHTVGWVDISSQKFIDIANSCAALVYPSCSEGGGGCVITCMHAGMIPLVSYESSVDVHNFGVIFPESSVEQIQAAVRKVANLPTEQLETMAKKAWQHARANHTRETFAVAYRQVAEEIFAHHSQKGQVKLTGTKEECLV
ncbi:glycosyltransferase [Calothrix sp. 336/3]|uniref:glycosyltransferase n=1 Tax=Calothrix sp. 336/3 TaxID=1337936 RepID=UPI0004E29D56|nr:glycosyltransferase [Calothrix sp. 336/3]AKG23274.1 glycosyl transferase family 1 [Calothrix sp. 336/3]